MKLKYVAIVFLGIFISFNVSAGKITRAYEAMSVYNYFDAKKLFTKSLKYNTSAGAEGLAIIYYRNDNPFHNYDSALFYIQKSIETFADASLRKREKWEPLGFTMDSITQIRLMVSTAFYEKAMHEYTVEALSGFIEEHPWANEVEQAILSRDSIAYHAAVNSNDSKAFQEFTATYPNSQYASKAQSSFYDLKFVEMTSSGQLSDYLTFLRENPDNPNRKRAEKKVYELTTASGEVDAYLSFITTYGDNAYVEDAWKKVLQLNFEYYSLDELNKFDSLYDHTIDNEVQLQRTLITKTLFPFVDNDKYGFIDALGEVIINAQYESVSEFSEGLAMFYQNDKIGFINNNGDIQIEPLFDAATSFQYGRSVVEIENRLGLIDRNGHFVLPAVYESMGDLIEDRVYASLSAKFGYYNRMGQMIIPHVYDDAYDFENGRAFVKEDNKTGIIGLEGEVLLKACYPEVRSFNQSIFIYADSSKYGLMTDSCATITEAKFEFISELSEGLAVAELNGRLVYIDSKGTIVIDNNYEVFPNYQEQSLFKNGKSIAVKDGLYGVINKRNEKVVKFKYDFLIADHDFYLFESEDLWGVIDSKEKKVIPPVYETMMLVENRYLIVSRSDSSGVLSIKGKKIVPVEFESVKLLKDSLFVVEQNGFYGVYKEENLIVPCKYDKVDLFDNNHIRLIEEGELKYFSLETNTLIEENE